MNDLEDLRTPPKRKPGRPPNVKVLPDAIPNPEMPVPEKKARVPFGGFTYKLEVAYKDPNYHYEWFKDVGDVLRRALSAGYEYVSYRTARSLEELTNKDVHGGNQSLDDTMRRHGGVGEYGREYQLVLMRQPMEFYVEDNATRMSKTDEIDDSIYRREFTGGKTVGNSYGDVRISTKDQE